MQVFRVDEIRLGPIDIIATDRDHAAKIFITALLDGLERHPGANFSISDWTDERLARFKRLERWVEQCRVGVIWPSKEGDDWEHIAYEIDAR
jgi:hypothetical protein